MPARPPVAHRTAAILSGASVVASEAHCSRTFLLQQPKSEKPWKGPDNSPAVVPNSAQSGFNFLLTSACRDDLSGRSQLAKTEAPSEGRYAPLKNHAACPTDLRFPTSGFFSISDLSSCAVWTEWSGRNLRNGRGTQASSRTFMLPVEASASGRIRARPPPARALRLEN